MLVFQNKGTHFDVLGRLDILKKNTNVIKQLERVALQSNASTAEPTGKSEVAVDSARPECFAFGQDV